VLETAAFDNPGANLIPKMQRFATSLKRNIILLLRCETSGLNAFFHLDQLRPLHEGQRKWVVQRDLQNLVASSSFHKPV
jgi:hypothetical protein